MKKDLTKYQSSLITENRELKNENHYLTERFLQIRRKASEEYIRNCELKTELKKLRTRIALLVIIILLENLVLILMR